MPYLSSHPSLIIFWFEGSHSNFCSHSPILIMIGGSTQIFFVILTCQMASNGGQKYHSSERHSSDKVSSLISSGSVISMSSSILISGIASSSTETIFASALSPLFSPPPARSSLQPANKAKRKTRKILLSFIIFYLKLVLCETKEISNNILRHIPIHDYNPMCTTLHNNQNDACYTDTTHNMCPKNNHRNNQQFDLDESCELDGDHEIHNRVQTSTLLPKQTQKIFS